MKLASIVRNMKSAYKVADTLLARPSIMWDNSIEDKIVEVFTAIHKLNGAAAIGGLIGAVGALGYEIVTGSPYVTTEALMATATLIPASVVLIEIMMDKQYLPELEVALVIPFVMYAYTGGMG